MSRYLTKAQVDKILAPINPGRVQIRDGHSNVQAYEVRAQMARIFGVCRWSSKVIEQHKIVEREVTTKKGDPAWQVGYHSIVEITVYAPDGTYLATYSEGHAGGSTHPDPIEAHGNAITNSESYAFKRAAVMALLDQGGLSLYGKGSVAPLVYKTLYYPFDADDVDAPSDSVEPDVQVVAEDERPVWVDTTDAPDPRTTNAPVLALTVDEIRARTEAITKARR